MLFSSSVFLWAFLPTVIIVNFFIKPKYSNIWLLLVSLFFYAWGEPICVLLMLFSIVLNWSFGIWIDRTNRYRKLLLVLCVVVNLAILGYFKYFNFFVEIFNNIAGTALISAKEITLPIGISFFTFQALSYVIDLYRGDCKVQKNVLNLALYVSFFPQLIAGPIVRYHSIDEQIESRTVTVEKFASGFRRFLYGLGKKIIISNAAAELVDSIFALPIENLTTLTAWLGAVAYMMQIYYDFSGYSDMAIGLGRIFGFEFLENFRYPYLSRSIQEFWNRWHISLGTWFKEYVYIPLGGNRKGTIRTYVNLISVFFLTGLWHGASWNFIIWGLYHGLFQILERIGLKKFLSKHALVSRIYCLAVVLFGWVMFRANTLMDSARYILRMIVPWRYGLENMFEIPVELTLRNGLMLTIALIGCGWMQSLADRHPVVSQKWKGSYMELIYLAVICLYCTVLLAAGTYNPFIYFRF